MAAADARRDNRAMQPSSNDTGGAASIAVAGLIALAVAMGIGRFAFTPILPMMEADAGLTLKAAGWLAAANYLGYLLGALSAARLPRVWAIRGSLLLIAVVTFAMGMSSMGMGGMGAMSFTIDGRTFDPGRDDQTATLGTIEEWTVVNTSPMEHPFHLHAWPFQVTATSTGTTTTALRQDVTLIPAQGWVRLRVPFLDYDGRSVFHCHILDHEDHGMMGTVHVTVPP